jgi:hypothetical protein
MPTTYSTPAAAELAAILTADTDADADPPRVHPDLEAEIARLEADLAPAQPLAPIPAADALILDHREDPMTGEWISARAREATLIQEWHGTVQQEMQCRVRTGDILLELRDLCARPDRQLDDGHWQRVLTDCGITAATAAKRMRVARAVRALPSLSDLARANWSKALALIESTDEETLEQVAAGTLPDLRLDDIDRLSVSGLKARVRQLTDERDREVRAQTKVLERERDDAIREAQTLRNQVDPTWTALGDQLARLRRAAAALADEVRTTTGILEHISGDDPALRQTLESAIRDSSELFRALWQQYQERAAHDWPERPTHDHA